MDASVDASQFRVLNRFSKKDLADVGKLLGVSTLDKPQQLVKRKLISHILDECKGRPLSLERIAELDLLYYQRHTSRKWKVLQLQGHTGAALDVMAPLVLQRKLNEELKLVFHQHTCVRVCDSRFWIRIAIFEDEKKASISSESNTIYMVHIPGSPFVLTSTIKVEHRECIYSALCTIFKSVGISECQLSGKNIGSLDSLLTERDSQGPFSVFRLQLVDNNPLQGRRSIPSTAEGAKDRTQLVNNKRIIRENSEKKRFAEEEVTGVFGPGNCPAIDSLEIQLDKPNQLRPGSLPISITFKFEGSNVLEGIKQLIRADLAQAPLPSFLIDLPRANSNVIRVDSHGVCSTDLTARPYLWSESIFESGTAKRQPPAGSASPKKSKRRRKTSSSTPNKETENAEDNNFKVAAKHKMEVRERSKRKSSISSRTEQEEQEQEEEEEEEDTKPLKLNRRTVR